MARHRHFLGDLAGVWDAHARYNVFLVRAS